MIFIFTDVILPYTQRLLKVKFFEGSHTEDNRLDQIQINPGCPPCSVWTVFFPLLSQVCCEYTSFPVIPLFPCNIVFPDQITAVCSLLDSKVLLAILPPLHSRGEATPWMLRTVLINEPLHYLFLF